MKNTLFRALGLTLVAAALFVMVPGADALAATQSLTQHAGALFSGDTLTTAALAGAALFGRIKVLRDKKAALLKEADELGAKEDAGTLTEDEKKRLAAILPDLDQVNASIVREERLMEERRSIPAITDANADTEAERRDRIPANAKKEPEKFKSLGEMMVAVAKAGQPGVTPGEWDRRLHAHYVPGQGYQAASGANEGVPSEGGFGVQQDIGAPLIESVFEQGRIISQVQRVPISANSNGLKVLAIDESSRVDGSRWGGVQAYWADEADTVTASRPKFREMDLRLKKLMAIFYATDELLADAAALERVASMAFAEEMTFKAENAIVNGTGQGQPLGFLNSGALISVAAESGQAASTIVTANILNMWNRLPPRSKARAVWLVNQDVEPQLQQLVLGSGTAVVRLYSVPGDRGNNLAGGLGELLGRPVIPVEYCAALGTAGDIVLADLGTYLMIDKDGIQRAASMHVRFLYNEQTFRWTLRLDGQPMWRSAVTPKNGSNTLSPYVALATRS